MLEKERIRYSEPEYKENYQEDKLTESECKRIYGNCWECPRALC